MNTDNRLDDTMALYQELYTDIKRHLRPEEIDVLENDPEPKNFTFDDHWNDLHRMIDILENRD